MPYKVFRFNPEVSGEHSKVLSSTVAKSDSHFRKIAPTAK